MYSCKQCTSDCRRLPPNDMMYNLVYIVCMISYYIYVHIYICIYNMCTSGSSLCMIVKSYIDHSYNILSINTSMYIAWDTWLVFVYICVWYRLQQDDTVVWVQFDVVQVVRYHTESTRCVDEAKQTRVALFEIHVWNGTLRTFTLTGSQVRDVAEQTPKSGPSFINIFIHPTPLFPGCAPL